MRDLPRKPRTHLFYEVETEGAVEKKELPFIVGVVGDFSGNPTSPLKKFSERSFVQLTPDNFDEVMAGMKPGLNLRVKNTLKDDGSEMAVQLKFTKMDDFTEVVNILNQVPALRQLLEDRNKLRDLLARADLNEDLEELLEKILSSSDTLKQLAQEAGKGGAEETGGEESGGGEG
jgi:type VI secretion system protein ImpB